MAAAASPPALRLRPGPASPSALAFSVSPRCRFTSFAYSYSKFARSRPVQRVNGSRMHLDTLKGQVFRSSSNHDGRFHIERIISCAATDKQELITSPNTDTPVLEETESSTGDPPASASSSYFTERGVGKPGFISFQGSSSQTKSVESVPHPGKEASRLVWFVGPTILVAFLVLPSLYLRKVLSAVFEDSLLTDFLILFFTEALFYGGVAIFVLLIDKVWRPLQQVAPKSYVWSKSRFFRISSVTTMVLSLIIPLLTMGMVWPWTGPAASATLAPYLVGLVVQFAFEQYARYRKSPSWPVIPIIFKVYRLHQLNRAAQLVTALTFSVRGTEGRGVKMKAIGSGGEWWWNFPSLRRKHDSGRRGRRNPDPRGRRRGPPREPLSSSSESIGQSRGWPIDFPFKQAATAASLTLTGDTIAQVRRRIVDRRSRCPEHDNKGLLPDLVINHDWLRALRMASYGFLLYGPGSYAWYQLLDGCMPQQTFVNLSTKVILNQIVLGPCVIAVIFAWNNMWLGKLSELPSKYQNDALPTLLYGFRFWIPVSVVNFGMIPLSARVAFMSACSIFWNFYLSTTMSK